MPWNEVDVMKQRKDFIHLLSIPDVNVSAICRRLNISRKTAYKWLNRAKRIESPDWCRDRSRRPRNSPNRVAPEVEEAVLRVRQAHPAWGGRKIRKILLREGRTDVPAPSTITAILHRYGQIDPVVSQHHEPMTRFERQAPNELWQMDFKGYIRTATGLCHPLTVIDDHSRYAVCIAACPNEREQTVRWALTNTFRLYGLPERMLMDNGPCWGRIESKYTILEAWLIRLGVTVNHGRPFHPQTQGKNERFNRTLKAEALTGRNFHDLAECQRVFDRFRLCYNTERPHEAINFQTPIERYRVSVFEFPETLPPLEYMDSDIVRKVTPAGYVSYHKDRYHVGRAFSGQHVALRTTATEGVRDVYYAHKRVAVINLKERSCKQC
jgi:transposase InsO family protein